MSYRTNCETNYGQNNLQQKCRYIQENFSEYIFTQRHTSELGFKQRTVAYKHLILQNSKYAIRKLLG